MRDNLVIRFQHVAMRKPAKTGERSAMRQRSDLGEGRWNLQSKRFKKF